MNTERIIESQGELIRIQTSELRKLKNENKELREELNLTYALLERMIREHGSIAVFPEDMQKKEFHIVISENIAGEPLLEYGGKR